MKLTLDINETQAYILRDALDAYSRLLAGQVSIAVMDATHWMINRKDHKIDHDKLRLVLDEAQRLVTGLTGGAGFGIYAKETHDRARQAYDLQQVIRHAVAWHLDPKPESCFRTVDYHTPARTSEKEEMPKCEVV